MEQTASGRRELLHAARSSSTLARLLAAKACRTARCRVERRRLPRGHRVAGPWSRHGRTRGRRQASHRPSTCAPSLAALGRRTDRAARWSPLGRRLHEVLELRSTAPPRRRRGSRTRGRRKAFHRSWMRAWSLAVLGRRLELRRQPRAGRLGRATRSRRGRRNASHSPLIRAASLAALGRRIEPGRGPQAGRLGRATRSRSRDHWMRGQQQASHWESTLAPPLPAVGCRTDRAALRLLSGREPEGVHRWWPDRGPAELRRGPPLRPARRAARSRSPHCWMRGRA
jgi:hypothetical protein